MKKKLYRIGTAANLLGLKTYVLRFWETQYPELAPSRSPTGQRLYTEKQIALFGRIKELLHEQGMTTAGVQRILKNTSLDELLKDKEAPKADYSEIREELLALRAILAKPEERQA